MRVDWRAWLPINSDCFENASKINAELDGPSFWAEQVQAHAGSPLAQRPVRPGRVQRGMPRRGGTSFERVVHGIGEVGHGIAQLE